ncbi:MAG TPA: hypothetical protein VG826_34890 [Pirellulales bacterium]|nr:hypothetical protein [Pirellulales bacterium]
MRRPQFTLRALLVAMQVVAAFFGGAAWQRKLDEPRRFPAPSHWSGPREPPEQIELRDGSRWYRSGQYPPSGNLLQPSGTQE